MKTRVVFLSDNFCKRSFVGNILLSWFYACRLRTKNNLADPKTSLRFQDKKKNKKKYFFVQRK